MKNRILFVLLLAAALALPAMAQQTSNDPAKNPPAATQEQNLSARQPLTAERHEGFWGKLNPFARKKYVQRQMEPIRGRVNELDELTAANAKNIRDVDARAQEGIRLASARANEADQHAIEAGNTARLAHETAQKASTRLNTVENVVGSIDQYQPVTSAEIRFRSGQTGLSTKAKEALDQIAEPVKNQKGYIVEVQGFSPGKGQAAIENSQRMAESVVRYLVLNHDIPVYRIYVLGMGSTPRPAQTSGEPARRVTGGRVEVSLLKNSVEQLGVEASGAAPAASETVPQ